MGNDRKFRALAIAAICVAVVGVSVAYAALSASLTITGTATVDTSDTWNVNITNLSCEATGKAVFADDATTKEFPVSTNNIEWSATFKAPGDKVVCTATIKNEGSIDAAVTALTRSIKGATTEDAAAVNEFDYSVKVGNLEMPTTYPATQSPTYYKLAAKDQRTVTITVTFDGDRSLTDLSTVNGKTVVLEAGFGFAQTLDETTYSEFPTA